MSQNNTVESVLASMFWKHAADPMYIVDQTGNILHSTLAMMEETHIWDLDPWPHGAGFDSIFKTAQEKKYHSQFYALEEPSGVTHRLELRVFALRPALPTDKPQVMFQFRKSIDADGALEVKRNLERQLQQAQKMEALGALASGIAHDFNNVLASILGASEVALEYLDDTSKAKRYVTTVHRAGVRGKDLVKQILRFSKPHQDAMKVLVLQDILVDCASLLRPMIPPNVEIKLNLGDEELWLNADESRMQQVITNIVTNAFQAMPDGGSISIEMGRALPHDVDHLPVGDYAFVKIEDTGRGMPAEVLKQIFEPFYTTKSAGEGTGLGLSVVQGILKVHGGDVRVQSEVGAGTCFLLFLPLEEPTAGTAVQSTESFLIGATQTQPQDQSAKEVVVPQGQGQRILLVDDEPWLLDVGIATLELLNYQVQGVGSPREALRLVQDAPDAFDVIMTDYWMPEMHGAELAREIHQASPKVPVIVVTGDTDMDDVAVRCGKYATKVLLKPLARDVLADALAHVLSDSTDSRK